MRNGSLEAEIQNNIIYNTTETFKYLVIYRTKDSHTENHKTLMRTIKDLNKQNTMFINWEI